MEGLIYRTLLSEDTSVIKVLDETVTNGILPRIGMRSNHEPMTTSPKDSRRGTHEKHIRQNVKHGYLCIDVTDRTCDIVELKGDIVTELYILFTTFCLICILRVSILSIPLSQCDRGMPTGFFFLSLTSVLYFLLKHSQNFNFLVFFNISRVNLLY